MASKETLNPIQKFIQAESFSGILLFSAMILALVLSNSAISTEFEGIWQYKFGIQTSNFSLVKPLILWINDGLMAVFFFLIGLEIKREILVGELNSFKKASLPIFAAIGGMIIPLSVYLLLNQNPLTVNGWGISMATDIAFTLAILTLLGKGAPLSLKIFLTAFAIIDDIGAVLVIALFYTSQIAWSLLFYAALLLVALYILTFLKLYSKPVLFIFGIAIWVLFLKSGVHPTIAGIMLAFAVPIRQKMNEHKFAEKIKASIQKLTHATNTNPLPMLSHAQIEEIDHLEELTTKVQSPLQKLEHKLHYWVAFMIMPVFALSNAGIGFSSDMEIDTTLALNLALALFIGKTVGVTLFASLSVKLKWASLPESITWLDIVGVAVLSGVGFTMALFIGNLAFAGNEVFINSAKIGIISGSLISGVLGFIILKVSIVKKKALKTKSA